MKKIKRTLITILSISLLATGCQFTKQNVPGVASTQLATSQKSDSSEPVEYASLFDPAKIHSIDITIAEQDLTAIYKAPLDETYYSATINLDGTTVENVGVRTKGNSTLKQVANTDSKRFSFKINTSKYVDNQKLAGLDEFVLNNMFSDASYLKEYLSYELMSKMGMTVPLYSFTKVSINGKAVGFYLMVESVDDSFLNRVFNENEGNLYRQDEGSSLAVDSTKLYAKSNQTNGEDKSKEDIHALTTALAAIKEGNPGSIESILDVDSALSYIATNFILSSYDSYNSRMQQNYYLYNHNGVFSVIPWDYNMSFGGFPEQPAETLDVDTPVTGVTLESLPLIDKLLSVEAYKERYYEILKDYVVELEDIESRIKVLSDWIRPYVEADPTKFITMENFEAAIVYQENEVIVTDTRKPPNGIPPGNAMQGQGKPTGDMTTGERPNSPPELPQNGEAPGPKGMMDPGSGRSLINVIRDTVTAVKEQVL